MPKECCIVVAESREGLFAAAQAGAYEVVERTARRFERLDTRDDQGFGDIGEVKVAGPGWVALAVRDAQ